MSGHRVDRVQTDADRPVPAGKAAVRQLEPAQLVWRRAVALARSDQGSDGFVASLDLLRTAHHGPSTMLHALGLGQAQQRAAPEDIPTRDAVRLITRTIGWLGRPIEPDEVGAVGSPAIRDPRPSQPW